MDHPKNGAGDGTRTRDIQLGKLTFYQLNYTRKNFVSSSSCEIFVRGETLFLPLLFPSS